MLKNKIPGKHYLGFTKMTVLLLALNFAGSVIAATSNPRDEREERQDDDDHAWEFRPQAFISFRSNPLLGDPEPLRLVELIPVLSYYGEQFFFDEVVGYTWYETDHFMFNTIVSVPEDFILFSDDFYDFDNNPEIKYLDTRHPTLEAGIELWFDGDFGELVLQLETDVLNEYSGQTASLTYGFTLDNHRWEVRPQIGVVWKSQRYIDYFYGVSASDASATGLSPYTAQQAINWIFQVEARYELYPAWNAIIGYYIQLADDSLQESPLVAADRYTELYLGVEWVKRFSLNF